ncbi:MAG: hypothetical protein M1383_03380 [Patescibacteria group bacterium]|nr:hypothetical protein [Patescibacteria group bacterium]
MTKSLASLFILALLVLVASPAQTLTLEKEFVQPTVFRYLTLPDLSRSEDWSKWPQGMENYLYLNLAFVDQLRNAFSAKKDGKPVTIVPGLYDVVSVLNYGEGNAVNINLVLACSPAEGRQLKPEIVWQQQLGIINVSDVVPDAARSLWKFLVEHNLAKPLPPRPACFQVDKYPEYLDGQPFIGKDRLHPPLRETTYKGEPMWLLRFSAETYRYYPFYLKPGTAIIVDKNGIPVYDPGMSLRLLPPGQCSEQEMGQAFRDGVMYWQPPRKPSAAPREKKLAKGKE